MPKILDAFVKKLKTQWKTEESAYAIATSDL